MADKKKKKKKKNLVEKFSPNVQCYRFCRAKQTASRPDERNLSHRSICHSRGSESVCISIDNAKPVRGEADIYYTPTATSSFFENRLAGPVVKASASRAEDPGFESRLRRDFSGVEAYQ